MPRGRPLAATETQILTWYHQTTGKNIDPPRDRSRKARLEYVDRVHEVRKLYRADVLKERAERKALLQARNKAIKAAEKATELTTVILKDLGISHQKAAALARKQKVPYKNWLLMLSHRRSRSSRTISERLGQR